MKCNRERQKLLNMVKQETVPAIGCTEPVAVAYACSVAKKHFKGNIEKLQVYVSGNIYKNGKSVIIPNTGECGLDLAAVLGIICGNSEEGLMVLRDISEKDIYKAHEMIKENKISIFIQKNVPNIYVKVVLENRQNKVEVLLKDSHTNIAYIKTNEEIIFESEEQEDNEVSTDFLRDFTFKAIREICEEIDIEDLAFIEEGIYMNKRAALEGIKCDKGLGLGSALMKLEDEGKICNTAPTRARILTAAGADFRMGGGGYPIMTSAGSGNQGLGVILPIVVVAEEYKIHKDDLLRAIFFGHIINKYIKVYTGKLSAMCGCAIAAGIGASAAITWMLGGNDRQICGACKNMLSNLTGMICDGAKGTCALKLSTSAEEAVLSAYLAIENIIAPSQVGIIGETIEETIENVGILCKEGFSNTDEVILNIIK